MIKLNRCPMQCLLWQKHLSAQLAWHGIRKITVPDEELAKIKESIPEEFWEYTNVFSEVTSTWMPLHKPWDHRIDLKPDFMPKKRCIISMSDEELKEISAFMKDQLAKGYIHPSKSPQTSLVFFIPKKDGKKHMVTDYQCLNKGIICNNYPLPLILQLIDKLKGSDMYTKMDLCWGYNNVCIKDGDKWKGAFVTPISSYEPIGIFFSMCNSPSIFQQMMNDVFSDEM